MIPIIRELQILGELVAECAGSEFRLVDILIRDSEVCDARLGRDGRVRALPSWISISARGGAEPNVAFFVYHDRVLYALESDEAVIRPVVFENHLSGTLESMDVEAANAPFRAGPEIAFAVERE